MTEMTTAMDQLVTDLYDYNYDFDFDNFNKAMELFDFADNFNIYCKPILIIICFIGNGLSLVVLNSKDFKDFPQKHLLTIIALLDISVAIIFGRNYLSLYVVPKGTSVDMLVHDVSPAVCKSYLYFLYLTTHLSAWTIVLLTLERFFVTWFPLRFRDILSSKRTLLVWVVMALIFILIELPLVFIIDYYPEGHSVFTCDFISPTWSKMWDYLDLVLMCIGPFLILTVLDSLIIYKLHANKREMSAMNSSGSKSNDDKLRGLTAMMLSICLVFIFTTTPLAIYNFGSKSWFASDDILVMATDFKQFTILDNLYVLNHSVNFIFYFAVGPRFREAFLNVFCGCMRRNHLQGSQQTASTGLSKSQSIKK